MIVVASKKVFGVADKPQSITETRCYCGRLAAKSDARCIAANFAKLLELFKRSGADMPSGVKAAANENKHSYVVELPVASGGLDVKLSRAIVQFHKSRQIQPCHGRIILRDRGLTYRWCFDDLSTANAFIEEFGGKFFKLNI